MTIQETVEARCFDPAVLPIVDAAFDHPNSEAGRILRGLCRRCEVQDTCRLDGASRSEHGVWGDTSSRQRSIHYGATAPTKAKNLIGVHPLGGERG